MCDSSSLLRDKLGKFKRSERKREFENMEKELGVKTFHLSSISRATQSDLFGKISCNAETQTNEIVSVPWETQTTNQSKDFTSQTQNVEKFSCETQTNLSLDFTSQTVQTDWLGEKGGGANAIEAERTKHISNETIFEEKPEVKFIINMYKETDTDFEVPLQRVCRDFNRALHIFPKKLFLIDIKTRKQTRRVLAENFHDTTYKIIGCMLPWTIFVAREYNLDVLLSSFDFDDQIQKCVKLLPSRRAHHDFKPYNSILKLLDGGEAIRFFEDGCFELIGFTDFAHVKNMLLKIFQITLSYDFYTNKISLEMYDKVAHRLSRA